MKNLNYLQPGLYPGLTFDQYRAYGRFGGTDAAYLATHTPAHWQARKKQPASPAMMFGTAAHCLLLEGREAFEQQFIVSPGFDRRTKNGKSDHFEFVSAHAGKEILSPLEYNSLMEMQYAFLQSKTVERIMEGLLKETSLFWNCPISDVECCGRFDAIGGGIAVDLKTTQDASPDGFLRAVKQYGYHIQAGHYLDGLDEIGYDWEEFYFIAIETNPPYGLAVYQLDDEMINAGRRLAIQARHKFMEAEEYGYCGYMDSVVQLSFNGVVENNEIEL